MVAAQAHGACVAPPGAAFATRGHSDVTHGAAAGADAAAYASVGGVEWSGRHSELAEPRIDDTRFNPRPAETDKNVGASVAD